MYYISCAQQERNKSSSTQQLDIFCKCASGSVGRAPPCQGGSRGFESRLALSENKKEISSRISQSVDKVRGESLGLFSFHN